MNIRALLGALLICAPMLAHAASPSIVTGSERSEASTGNAATLTISSYVVPAGADALLVCLSARADGSPRHGTAVTWNGLSLTKVAASEHSQSGSMNVEAWILDDPAAATSNLVATTDTTAKLGLAAVAITGTSGKGRTVERPSIPPAPSGYASSVQVSLADAATDSLLTDCSAVGNDYLATATAAGQTQSVQKVGLEHRLLVSSRVNSGALGWSVNTTTRWGQALIEWLPTAVVTPPAACSCTSESFTPTDGLYDITASAYGATCDGVADDTDELLGAIRQHGAATLRRNSLKMPNRSCKVSDTLQFRRPLSECGATTVNCWLTNAGLYGSGPAATIQLPDAQDGFGTSVFPKPVVYTASLVENDDPSSRRATGAGAKAFQNEIFDMTIDTGTGNPGAIGVDWINSNFGGIRRTKILSSDNRGVAGILATRYGQGPGFWSDVTIAGFDRCVDLGEFDYGMTLERMDCTYNVTGIRVTSNTLTARKLLTSGAGPAIQNVNSNGTILLIDSVLTCTANCSGPAIVNASGKVLLRNVSCPGFVGGCLPGSGATVAEFSTHGPFSAFTADARATLGLPVKDAPKAFNPADHALRANCSTFGAGGTGVDSSLGLAAAMASGRPVVYCPSTTGYFVSQATDVPASTRVVDFLGASMKPFPGSTPAAVFVVSENSAEPLHIRRLWASGFASGTPLVRRTADCTRTVVIEDAAGALVKIDGPGEAYINDVTTLLEAHAGAEVWARQLNTEGVGTYITNDGAKVWVLGIKTERANQVSLTTGGGCTEILGGLTYVTEAPPAGRTAHEVVDSSGFFFHAETSYVSGNRYETKVRETRAGVTQELLHASLPGRGLGAVTFGSAHAAGCLL